MWNWPHTNEKGTLLARFDCPIICADFSACDNLLACGAQDGTVKIINVADPNQTRKFKAHEGQVKGIAFDPQRKLLATAGSDGLVNIFDYTDSDTRISSVSVVAAAVLRYENLKTIFFGKNSSRLFKKIT